MSLFLSNFRQQHKLRIVKWLKGPLHGHSQQIPPQSIPHTRSAAGSVSVQIQTKMARSGQRFSLKQLPFLYTPVRAVYYYVKFMDFSKKTVLFPPLTFTKIDG